MTESQLNLPEIDSLQDCELDCFSCEFDSLLPGSLPIVGKVLLDIRSTLAFFALVLKSYSYHYERICQGKEGLGIPFLLVFCSRLCVLEVINHWVKRHLEADIYIAGVSCLQGWSCCQPPPSPPVSFQ